MDNEYAVEMTNIVKKFAGVKAIDDVCFKVKKGVIHALVGENGAGKSTLMNVLSGRFLANSGTMVVDGEKVRFSSPHEATKKGIAIVHQELALIPELSVAENMFMGNLPMKAGTIDWKKMYEKATDILKNLSLEIDVKKQVKYLSIGQQQLVEISKAIMLGGKVMILDEPTAPLTEREIDFLFKIIKDLKDKGITIIYISHRLEEIFKLTDYVSVMRDGKMIETKKTEELTNKQLVSYMIGREMQDFYPHIDTEAGKPLLEINNYTVRHPEYTSKNIVKDVSMTFRAGEIVGISGLLGAGRTELMSAVIGAYKMKGKGKVKLEGHDVKISNPAQAIKARIGYVTEDRKGNGLILEQTIKFNTSLASINKIEAAHILSSNKEKKLVQSLIEQLTVKTKNMNNPVNSLSGGNQQKVVLAKWIATQPKVLILDEPTRGVDVGAKYEIYTIMKDLAKKGVAVIMISSDLPEVIGMSDRVYVMYEGKVTKELSKEQLTEDTIMRYATGVE